MTVPDRPDRTVPNDRSDGATSSFHGGPALAGPARSGWRAKVGAYIALTKPRIIELLLVTTVPTMILAQGGFPSWWLIIATLVGGTAAAGSANTLNMYYDRDIDALMNRTKKRPLVTGAVSPTGALIFGIALGVFSVLWLGLAVNWVAAGLAFAANIMYSVGYTILLKRHTSQNIVWGGAAGCMPVLIGWAAVTGSLDWAPFLLFGIIFFWTPPHYWPLSMKFKKDYAAAGVPMLPVVSADTRVARQMIGYTVAMIACSLALIPVAQMGLLYTVAAVAAGGWFLILCINLYRRAVAGTTRKLGAMKVFHGSITYLTLVFVALSIDPFLPF
ncbi:heme o synthase [Occultella aeris]|uniref:heme o synthase n=1 Tax=Occultella aeris TaxID=2761496 RepID=UPI0022B243B9|nr:heme o synthase [Occultella aeris]